MNRRKILRAAFLLPATLAAACSSQTGPAPIATIAAPSPEQAQSTQTEGATKVQSKPTFIEFFADW